MIDADEMRKRLRVRIAEKGVKANAYAREVLGVSPAFLCSILTGKKPPSRKILDHLGLRKASVYVEKES